MHIDLVVDKVEEWILRRIISGEFPEGDFLPTNKRLSQMLEVSRNTVTSAVGRLQSRGLLERFRSDGLKVMQLTQSADLRLLVQIIERAREADRRVQIATQLMLVVGRQTAGMVADAALHREELHLQWLERYIGFLGEAIHQEKKCPSIGLADLEFLRAMAGASKNVTHTVMLNSLRPLFLVNWPMGFGMTPVMSLDDHYAVLELLQKKNDVDASRFWTERWKIFATKWISALEKLDPQAGTDVVSV
ncbi:MAG: GntR family transcriptional regulator [Myxococcaceae bacterium]|nr:GntR family transcriptional regulator [Myxococcaceae bacterium]